MRMMMMTAKFSLTGVIRVTVRGRSFVSGPLKPSMAKKARLQADLPR